MKWNGYFEQNKYSAGKAATTEALEIRPTECAVEREELQLISSNPSSPHYGIYVAEHSLGINTFFPFAIGKQRSSSLWLENLSLSLSVSLHRLFEINLQRFQLLHSGHGIIAQQIGLCKIVLLFIYLKFP